MICKKCGKSFSDDYRFCDICGGPLEPEQEQPVDEANVEPVGQSEQQPVEQPTQQSWQQPAQQPPQQSWQPPQQGGWQPTPPPPPVNPAAQQPGPYWNVASQDQTVSFGEWLGIMLIPLIPCVGGLIYLVLMFVWAFGDSAKPSKKTWAQANLVLMLIGVGLFIIVMIIMAAAGVSLMDELNPYRYY